MRRRRGHRRVLGGFRLALWAVLKRDQAKQQVLLRKGGRWGTFAAQLLPTSNLGRGLGGAGSHGGGHGIEGMRERVRLLGGSFEAGPRVGGGFRVQARIPLDPTHEGGSHGA